MELIRARNLYAASTRFFMEEEPRIADCYRLAHTKSLVVVPFFISDGLHTQEDIPVMLGEARAAVSTAVGRRTADVAQSNGKNGKLVWYTPAIGSEPHLADVILEQVREAQKDSSSSSFSSS